MTEKTIFENLTGVLSVISTLLAVAASFLAAYIKMWLKPLNQEITEIKKKLLDKASVIEMKEAREDVVELKKLIREIKEDVFDSIKEALELASVTTRAKFNAELNECQKTMAGNLLNKVDHDRYCSLMAKGLNSRIEAAERKLESIEQKLTKQP